MSNEVLEGNRLIAEKFLGWKYQTKKQLWERSKIAPQLCPNGSWTDSEGIGHFELLFHTSWDWLLPVYKKFSELKFENDSIQAIHLNYCARINMALAAVDIDEAVKHLTNGINFYIQNQSK